MTNEPLPDPNVTGREFDAQAEANYTASAAEDTITTFTDVTPVQESTGYDNPVTSVETPASSETTYESTSEGWIESTPVADDFYSESYWVEEAPAAPVVEASAPAPVVEAPAAPVVEAPAPAPVVEAPAAPSYEAAVDSYVEAMAATPTASDDSYEYTK